MKTKEALAAEYQERALIKLAIAARGATASGPMLPSLRAIVRSKLLDAEAMAQEWGVLPTEREIVEERNRWAFTKLIEAKRRAQQAAGRSPAVCAAARIGFLDAVAVAKEWGVIA
jgi:hypothetical protein